MSVVAVTGSTGGLGGRVARLLSGSGALAGGRLVVRDPSRAPTLPDAEVRVASYDDRAASVSALQGVDVLLMVSASESPTRREEHRAFIDAAAEADVRHVVYTSFAGAAPDARFTLGRDHADAETAIGEAGRRTGMVATILRDNFYSDVLTAFAGEDRVLRGPAGQGLLAAVARDDVADVAAAVLADPVPHAGRTYQLTGPEAFTLGEAAERMTAALGRVYRYVEETEDEAYASRRRWSDRQWELDAWVSTYTAIRDGEVAEVTDHVQRLTGHPARPLEHALTAPPH